MTSDFFKNLQKNKELAAQKSSKDNELAAKYLDSGCDKDDKKDSKGAIEDYTKAIKLNPKYTEAYANRGCAKEELGDKKGALSDWYKALALGDKEAENWIRDVKEKYEMTPEMESTQKRFEELAAKAKQNGSNWLTEQVQILQPEELTLLIKLDQQADKEHVAWYNKNPGLIAGGDRYISFDLTVGAKSEYRDVVENYSELIEKLELDYYKSKYAEQLKESIDLESRTWVANADEGIIWGSFEGEIARFCYKDTDHGGNVYVPKRCILAAPDFYKIEDWDEITIEYLKETNCGTEEEANEEFEYLSEKCNEPIMVKYVNTIGYVDDIDGYESGWLDDDFAELEAQGVKYEDVIDPGGLSTWHDG